MKMTGKFAVFCMAVLVASACVSTGDYGTSTGWVISEGYKTDLDGERSYFEVVFYLPGSGNVTYEVEKIGEQAENYVRSVMKKVQDGNAVIENITAWIDPVIKQYMRERNVRVMFDYPWEEYVIIRSTNPESFDRVTYTYDNFLPPDDFDFDDEGPPPIPPGF